MLQSARNGSCYRCHVNHNFDISWYLFKTPTSKQHRVFLDNITMCANNMCMRTMHPHWLLTRRTAAAAVWVADPSLKKSDCSCPARCQLTASQARACGAAAYIPKHGQVVTTLVTSVWTAMCWHHRCTTQGWERLQGLARASGGIGTTMVWLAEWHRVRNAAWKKFLLRKRCNFHTRFREDHNSESVVLYKPHSSKLQWTIPGSFIPINFY